MPKYKVTSKLVKATGFAIVEAENDKEAMKKFIDGSFQTKQTEPATEEIIISAEKCAE